MNRSSKGFGLVGVVAAVVLLILAALFSASAKSNTLQLNSICNLDTVSVQVTTTSSLYTIILNI